MCTAIRRSRIASYREITSQRSRMWAVLVGMVCITLREQREWVRLVAALYATLIAGETQFKKSLGSALFYFLTFFLTPLVADRPCFICCSLGDLLCGLKSWPSHYGWHVNTLPLTYFSLLPAEKANVVAFSISFILLASSFQDSDQRSGTLVIFSMPQRSSIKSPRPW